MHRRRSFAAALLLSISVALGAAACGSSTSSGATNATTAASAATGSTAAGGGPGTTVAVRKDILAQQPDPPGAPGRTLTLIRYTIAPGAKLSPHIHPGIQMAAIDAGTLTYTVESGTATITRKGDPTKQPVTGPTTITLGPGDAVIEMGDMVHFGANNGSEPVIIVATLLTESDNDLAVTVSLPTTTAPTR